MYTKLTGGTIYDPINKKNGTVEDIYIHGDRIVATPPANTKVSRVFDLAGQIVMPGGIDIHTHIGGGKTNIARMMTTEDSDTNRFHRSDQLRSGSGKIIPSTFIAGYEYARLGYTMGFEPAALPSNARHAHMEMADTPLLDTGAYLVLGNNDYLLRMIAEKEEPEKIRDFIGWMLDKTQCMAVKIVNPGGISAFKFNQRKLDVNENNVHYGITPGDIVRTLSNALSALNVPHPLHVHASNLGVAGNIASTLETINLTDGQPIHLAHVQFHSYGSEGRRKFSSAAQKIADAVNSNPQVSVDVGHIMFGQTVTCSADTMHQYANRRFAFPRTATYADIECEEGCGVVPFRYQSKRFVNALQWAIGLELFLLIQDPWQVYLTTDHPNGASFTTYPHLIRLLMDHSYRMDMLSKINKFAADECMLDELKREYTLYEIAIITRAGPAKSLGFKDRGHLGPGAIADIAVYRKATNWEETFRNASLVFKDGKHVIENGEVVQVVRGKTHSVQPDYDDSIEKSLEPYFSKYRAMRLSNFVISDDEMANHIGSEVIQHPCIRTDSK